MKTFEEFLKDAQSNAELKAKLEAAVADAKTAEAEAAVIVKLAQENGYEVSVEDLSGQAAGKQKLDDEELQLASGGMLGGALPDLDEWCGWNHGCLVAYHACEYAVKTPLNSRKA